MPEPTDIAGLERRIQRIEDIEELKRLKATYVTLVDTGELDAFVELFVEDGVWEGEPFGSFKGRDAIRECMDDPEIPWSLHFVTAPSISVDDSGDRASARWYLLQTATFSDPDGSNPVAGLVLATYDDDCVKRDGRWYFEKVNARVHHVSELEEGWVRQPMRGAGASE